MNRLSPHRYQFVVLEKAPSSPLLVDLSGAKRIIENAEFVRHYRPLQDQDNECLHYFELLTSKNHQKGSSLDLKDALKILSLRVSNVPAMFSEEKSYRKWLKDKLVLFSERFYLHDSPHYGSSRHALVYDLQLKGCGRNGLVSRLDYQHSWGGMGLLEAIYSYTTSHLVDSALPGGALKTLNVSLLDNGHALILREADEVRVAQVKEISFLEEEKKSLHKDLESADEQIRTLVFQYASKIYLNFYHYSLSAENATLSGKIIDCEAVETFSSLETLNLFLDLDIFPKGKMPKEMSRVGLESLLESGKVECFLTNSNLHSIQSTLRETSEVMKKLFESEKGLNLGHELKKTLKEMLGKNARADIENYFDILKSPLRASFPLHHFLASHPHWDIFHFRKHKKHFGIRLEIRFPRPSAFGLLVGHFNKNKLSSRKICSLARQLIDGTRPAKAFRNALSSSSKIHQLLNANTFYLPFRNEKGTLVENAISLEEFSEHLRDHYHVTKKGGTVLLRFKCWKENSLVTLTLKKGELKRLKDWREVIFFDLECDGHHYVVRPIMIKSVP